MTSSDRIKFGLVVAGIALSAGLVLGSRIKDCEHSRGDCPHTEAEAEVQAVLDCLKNAGR